MDNINKENKLPAPCEIRGRIKLYNRNDIIHLLDREHMIIYYDANELSKVNNHESENKKE